MLAAIALIANGSYRGDPKEPHGWKAVSTRFGAISHTELSALFEFRIAEAIQCEALASDASVIIFPETVVRFGPMLQTRFGNQRSKACAEAEK